MKLRILTRKPKRDDVSRFLELEKAINEKNYERAKELIEKMIDRTQKGIEDN